jgi:serine/threonine-protein kinase HipA
VTDKQLVVYVDLEGAPHFVGLLWARSRKGKESATFEYDRSWIKSSARFALEPALMLSHGPQHTTVGRRIFGAVGDSAPDRWGRLLIQREERRKAREERRAPRSLGEADYLLGVSDFARQGALRFAEVEGGPFLATGLRIPPLVRLPALLNAALHITEDGGSDEDLKLLLAPGSSLGGARHVTSATRWEAVALMLAAKVGIVTPQWRIDDRTVLLLRRFDRSDGRRIPFLSAMSMLDAADNEQRSYLEIADALRQYGAKPEADCAQLWRRIVFSIFIANTDDHLRNHGFLYDAAGGWRLAPAYDINPVPLDIKPRILTTAIDETDGTGSLDLVLSTAAHYGLKSAQAQAIVAEVGAAVKGWRNAAKPLGLSSAEIDRMTSAFIDDSQP